MKENIPYPEDLADCADNIYESVVIIARRARKIGADQKLEIDKMLNTADTGNDEEEGSENVVEREKPELEYEKPSIIALRELMGKELEHEYRDKSSN